MKTQTAKDDPDSSQPIIPTVNFHLIQACNFKCKFCFAKFEDVKSEFKWRGKTGLSQAQMTEIVHQLADFGFTKINFAGGEPTLLPWLPDLVIEAKNRGMVTSMITNASKITANYLSLFDQKLDLIGLSIDSINPSVNLQSGRYSGKAKTPCAEDYIAIADLIKKAQCHLKINTVVHRYNKDEQLYSFIEEIKPDRWKIFRVLPVIGQNDTDYQELSISDDEFSAYLNNNHQHQLNGISEDHEEMRGSYIMVDPVGRFYDNTKGHNTYSKSILTAGVDAALNEVNYSFSKFIKRHGNYTL